MRDAIRLRHYSLRTERAYIYWVRWFIRHNAMRHPREMGAQEVTAFLTHLATVRNVAASTQNQALAALLFLYRDVLGVELPWLDGIHHAKRPRRLPVVLGRAEARALLAYMDGTHGLMARLMYGTGMRLIESGDDIRTVQELLGHKDVSTTMVYTHVLNRGGRGVVSPLDR